MMVEFEQEHLNKTLLSAGLTEHEVRTICAEFSKNNFVLDDEVLLDKLLESGKEMSTIILIFSRLGMGKETAVRMVEMRQKKKLGKLVEIHTLEVEE